VEEGGMTVRILQGVDSLGRRYTSRKKHRPCAHCGEQIERRGTSVQFCSRDCYAASIKGKPLAPDVVEARQYLTGESHPQWVGDAVSERGGRTRALRMYRCIGPCKCGATKAERHHRDGDTSNNHPDNIEALCRRCHMEADGRLAALRSAPGKGMPCR
jgi:hypothetical protein